MNQKTRLTLYFTWVVSVAAMAGSLYFSEVLHLPPCVLCWYQRILFYPLVWLIGLMIIRKDKNLVYYILPMAILWAGIALFHHLLQIGVLPDHLAPCSQGISCTTKFVFIFDFLTIPLMSFIAALLVSLGMGFLLKKGAFNER